jgi:hypothetical protein
MTDRPKDIPPTADDIATEERLHRDKGEGLKHVIDTGLPPGISVDEAIDPGRNTPAPQGQTPHSR